METKDPMSELLLSLEQIVLTRNVMQAIPALKNEVALPEPKEFGKLPACRLMNLLRH